MLPYLLAFLFAGNYFCPVFSTYALYAHAQQEIVMKTYTIRLLFVPNFVYIIVITWAWMVCLICTPDTWEPQAWYVHLIPESHGPKGDFIR